MHRHGARSQILAHDCHYRVRGNWRPKKVVQSCTATFFQLQNLVSGPSSLSIFPSSTSSAFSVLVSRLASSTYSEGHLKLTLGLCICSLWLLQLSNTDWGGLNDRNELFHSSGSWEPKTKVSTRLVLFERERSIPASFPWLVDGSLLLCPHITFPLHVSRSFLFIKMPVILGPILMTPF